MSDKTYSAIRLRVRLLLARIEILMVKAESGNAVAIADLRHVVEKVKLKSFDKQRQRFVADREDSEVFEIFESSLPAVQRFKRRLLDLGIVPDDALEDVRDDLKLTGADKLAADLGDWTKAKVMRLRKAKPSDWLYDEMGAALGMTSDQIHRAVLRGRGLRRSKQSRMKKSR